MHERPRRPWLPLVVVGGALAAVAAASVPLSFPLCDAVPSYDTCRKVPLCSAVRIESTHGPSWDCRSRFRP